MHYTVAVVTNKDDLIEVERLLAPFDENIEVEPYIYKTKEQIIKDFREGVENLKKDMEAYKKGEYDTEKYRTYWLEENSGELTESVKKRLELYEKSDEEIYQWYRDGDDDDHYDENGNELSTYNPESKWDWYEVGGRWDGYFELKDGGKANSAKISEIDWNGNDETRKSLKRFWEVFVDGEPLKEGEKKPFSIEGKDYYLDLYHTKEEYVRRASKTYPYAVITPDGEWVAPGEMGWFSSSETSESLEEYHTWFEDFINKHQDCYVTIVDCHI